MPELVNISVGSLRGTSGEEGTTAWPWRAKKSRKVERMSASEVIARSFRRRARDSGRRGEFPVVLANHSARKRLRISSSNARSV
jgi:hypothetical protein